MIDGLKWISVRVRVKSFRLGGIRRINGDGMSIRGEVDMLVLLNLRDGLITGRRVLKEMVMDLCLMRMNYERKGDTGKIDVVNGVLTNRQEEEIERVIGTALGIEEIQTEDMTDGRTIASGNMIVTETEIGIETSGAMMTEIETDTESVTEKGVTQTGHIEIGMVTVGDEL